MARAQDPNSANSQFFIVFNDASVAAPAARTLCRERDGVPSAARADTWAQRGAAALSGAPHAPHEAAARVCRVLFSYAWSARDCDRSSSPSSSLSSYFLFIILIVVFFSRYLGESTGAAVRGFGGLAKLAVTSIHFWGAIAQCAHAPGLTNHATTRRERTKP